MSIIQKTWVRRTLIAVALLIAALVAAVAAGLALAERKMTRKIDVAVKPVALPADAAALERGRYLYSTRGCTDCHAANGAGRLFLDKDGLKIAGPHIGNGSGSVTQRYDMADWDRAIRHGVAPGGRPLIVMPSEDYNRFGAMVAYLKQLPPVDLDKGAGPAVVVLPLPVRVLYGFGAIPDAASRIDHALPSEKPVPEGATVEHGRYVAQMCTGCHGTGFGGGPVPGGPPDWPAAANLTPGEGGVMVRYADAGAFARMMRSGQRPDGSTIGVMPFGALKGMSDVDLEGMYRYLQTLPARPMGSR
jgi:cytochrome c5